MGSLPITLLARCGCPWEHAVCRVNHPSGMPIVSTHGTFFLLILTGMCLDVEDTLFLHPLPFPLPHLCQAKSKVRQLRSQACIGFKLMNLRHEVCKTRVHRQTTVTRAVLYPTIYIIAPTHLPARIPIMLVLVALLQHESPFHIAVACTKTNSVLITK
jgi:hypothetical protein